MYWIEKRRSKFRITLKRVDCMACGRTAFMQIKQWHAKPMYIKCSSLILKIALHFEFELDAR